jgi:hypothetical protein
LVKVTPQVAGKWVDAGYPWRILDRSGYDRGNPPDLFCSFFVLVGRFLRRNCGGPRIVVGRLAAAGADVPRAYVQPIEK